MADGTNIPHQPAKNPSSAAHLKTTIRMAAENATAVTANDNNPETASTVAGATMIVLSIIIVACRFYTRLFLKSGLKWDDWFILIALTSLIAAGVLVLAGMLDLT